jgi:hypothetical protein
MCVRRDAEPIKKIEGEEDICERVKIGKHIEYLIRKSEDR